MAMMICSLVALAIGAILTLVGWLMVLVVAFRQGAGWGLGVLCFAPVKWVFVSRYWKQAKNGFITQMCGWGALVLALVLTACTGVMGTVRIEEPPKPADARVEAEPPAPAPARKAEPAQPPPAKPVKTAKKGPKRPARQTLSSTLEAPEADSGAAPAGAEAPSE
ncbi:MAG TPA: hypothetical protein PK280_11065 [Planctomycetota bacterium]|nr:hypothetical protein [Planctomycetota bacterium]